MKFCSDCGGSIGRRIPEGDNRERFVCEACDAIHYINPRVIAGCLPVWEDQVLLCRRANNPRSGFWTLPAGFLENNETIVDGAIRETYEEANAEVDGLDLYTIFSLPHISQIYLFYRARMTTDRYAPGVESLEVALFDEADIPWDELAFPVIRHTLEHYFSDRKQGNFPVRSRDIIVDRDPTRFS